MYIKTDFHTGFVSCVLQTGEKKTGFDIAPENHTIVLEVNDLADAESNIDLHIYCIIKKIIRKETDLSIFHFPKDMSVKAKLEIRNSVRDFLFSELYFTSYKEWREITKEEYESIKVIL